MIKSKLDDCKEEFEILFNRGLSDYNIAKHLNVNHCTVFQYRKKHNYDRESLKVNKEIPLTKDNEEVLIGTLLGDASLRFPKRAASPLFSCEHGISQREYCKYKALLLANLLPKYREYRRKTIDPRTGKYYESCCFRLPANPALKELYSSFYSEGKKHIPFNLLSKFSAKSLAILFMDDGNKMTNGYAINTNCFPEEEILKFRIFLLEKFNLETSMFKNHAIYILHKSARHFEELIKPYLHESMQYKLINVS